MKKIISLLLLTLLVLSLSGCSMLNDLLNGLVADNSESTTIEQNTTKETKTITQTKEEPTTVKKLLELDTPVVSIDDEGLISVSTVPNATSYLIVVTKSNNETEEHYLDETMKYKLNENEAAIVKACGDKIDYDDSPFSEKLTYVISTLEAPTITEDYGNFTWNNVAGAISYTVDIDGVTTTYDDVAVIRLNVGSKIKVKANASKEIYNSSYSQTKELKISKITVTVTIDNKGNATFTENGYATHYQYVIDGDEANAKIIDTNSLRVENGRTIKVRALYHFKESQYTIISDWSSTVTSEWENVDPSKLLSPDVTISEGLISWKSVDNAQYYEYKYTNDNIVRSTYSTSIEAFEYQAPLYIRAHGFLGFYEDSDWVGPIYYQYLHSPQVNVIDGIASWEVIPNAEYYEYLIDDLNIYTTTSTTVNLDNLGTTIKVKACSKYYLDSKYSSVDQDYNFDNVLTKSEVDSLSSTAFRNILSKGINGTKLTQLYDELDNLVYAFYSGSDPVPSDLSIAKINYTQESLTDDEAISIFKAYINDHPFYYFISSRFSYGSFLTIYVDEDYKMLNVRRNNEKIILNQLNTYKELTHSITDTFEAATAVHDLICQDMYYAYDNNGTPETGNDFHNILGLFVHGRGVCESYAESFNLIMNMLGFETLEVTGTGNGGPHAWNMIKINNKYYLIDVTWDDEDTFGFEVMKDFFIKTENEPLSNGNTFGSMHIKDTDFNYPVVSTTPYQE